MNSYVFNALFTLLLGKAYVTNQSELANFLRVQRGTITKAKHNGYITIKTILKGLEQNSELAEDEKRALIEEIQQKVPLYDASQKEGEKSYKKLNLSDCAELLSVGSEKCGFTDGLALSYEFAARKLPGQFFSIIEYPKMNMEPVIRKGAFLVVSKIDQFDGPGYYVANHNDVLQVVYIDSSLSKPGKVIIYRTPKSNSDSIMHSEEFAIDRIGPANHFVAKVLYTLNSLDD